MHHLDITYTLVNDGQQCGTVTKDQVLKGKQYDRVVTPLLKALLEINEKTAFILCAVNIENYASCNDISESAASLNRTVTQALSILLEN